MKIVHIVINKAFGELDIFNQCSCFTQKPRLSMLLKIKKNSDYQLWGTSKCQATGYLHIFSKISTLSDYYYYFHFTIEQIESQIKYFIQDHVTRAHEIWQIHVVWNLELVDKLKKKLELNGTIRRPLN